MTDKVVLVIKHIEMITFNAISFGYVALNATSDMLSSLTDWQSGLIVLSIVFLNVARGIQALRKKKGK